MARKLRVEYPGAVYHVMNRGDRREPIFRDAEDRRRFITTLGEACGKTGWQVHALCLMDNPVMEERRAGEVGADYRKVRRGWCLGSQAFRKELLGQMQEQMGAEHYGVERQETAEAQAEGIVVAELKRRRWREEDLMQRAKGEAVKVALAARLRAETVMTVKWIAERLRMGSPGYVNHLLYRQRKAGHND